MSGRGPVDDLRSAFDAAFAVEPPPPVEHVDLVALSSGERSYAVRVAEVSGIVPFGGISPFPCDEPAMLGIAAVRGAPVPVYDLALLLGEGPGEAQRWMLLSAGTRRVALAFDEIEEYLRIPRAGVGEVVRHGAVVRAVVSVEAIVRQLEERLGAPAKET